MTRRLRLDERDWSEVRRSLLAWFEANGRRIGARDTADPWRILVLEVMSQQTQIERAASASEAFCAAFPSPGALATASPADAVRAWSGLGYNRRAIALWRAAGAIAERHGGGVPSDVAALDALPGVGAYTARAVAVHAFGLPVAPVDVNIATLVGRLIGSSDVAAIQAAADALLDPADPSRSVHAVMDFSAAVCRRRAPRCGDCPLAVSCASAFAVPAPTARAAAAPFRATRRWLRGEILRQLVGASDWVDYSDRPVGAHEPHAVREALAGLASDGLIELDPPSRARLRPS